MSSLTPTATIYDDNADDLIVDANLSEKLVIVPDGKPTSQPDRSPRIRIMWGQHLLDDVIHGRYRTLVCAVNAEDNSHGIISQLATLLTSSMWTPDSINAYAQRFAEQGHTKVLKYDMDVVEILAILRPADQKELTLNDLNQGFEIVADMLQRRSDRRPSASVSFLGARANRLRMDASNEEEPSFESVLRSMADAGYDGDVYPSPKMWDSQPTALYARYPFPESVDKMRSGGS
jgi:hypothetical protein